MKKNKRDCLRISGLAGICLAGSNIIELVRIGFIGVDARGICAVGRMRMIEGVEIKAICDKLSKAAGKTMKAIEGSGNKGIRKTGKKESIIQLKI